MADKPKLPFEEISTEKLLEGQTWSAVYALSITFWENPESPAAIHASHAATLKGKRLGRLDTLGKLIRSIRKSYPNEHWTALMVRLQAYEGLGIVNSMKGGLITWTNRKGETKTTPYDAIEDRVSKLKD